MWILNHCLVYGGKHTQLLLFLTSGLAILTKVSGLCIVGGSIVFLLSKKDRNVIFPVLGSLFGGILLLLYANAYDLSWFIQLQMFQSHLRFSSLINFVEGFYFQSKLGVKQFFDSSALVAKLALTSTFLQNQHLQWFQPFAFYSIFQILFIYLAVGEFTSAVPGLAPGPSLYGWYFYPLIYLCIIPLTWIVKHIITSENKLSFIFLNVLWLPQLRTFFSALQSRKSIYREEFYYFCDRTPSWNVFCYRETLEKSCLSNSRDTYLREYRCCSEHDRLA